jgi:TPR repeat protein
MDTDTMKAAADLGERHAAYRFGTWLLAKGSYGEARRYFQRAAAAYSPEGQAALGQAQLFGVGGPHNPISGTFFLERAAGQGHPDAQYLLYECYRHGKYGVRPDPNKAALYLELARDNGIELDAGRSPDTWEGVDFAVLTAELRRFQAVGRWNAPITTFQVVYANDLALVGKTSFEAVVRLAAERGSPEAALVMVEASIPAAVKAYWQGMADDADADGFVPFPGARELWPVSLEDAQMVTR